MDLISAERHWPRTTPMKPTQGGKRAGAGRKPTGTETRVRRSITLEPSAWARLDEEASGKGVSASELVNRFALKIKNSPPR